MAKYDITYSCGHEETIQLFGPEKDRRRKIEYFERSGKCPDCYKAAKRAEADAAGPLFTMRIVPGYNPEVSRRAAEQALELAERELRFDEEMGRDESCLRRNRDEVEKRRRDVKYAADEKRIEPAVEIIATRSTFAIKDQLKARGYRFGRFEVANHVLDIASEGEPGWALRIPASNAKQAAESAAAELAWIAQQGWEIAEQGRISTMLASVAEGRLEMLGYVKPLSDEAYEQKLHEQQVQFERQREARRQRWEQAEEDERQRAKLTNFVVVVAETGEHGAITVASQDGRTLTGWLDDGELLLCTLRAGHQEIKVRGSWPEIQRIEREARALLAQQKNGG